MMNMSGRYYLVITIVLLLDTATSSLLSNRYFRNSKLSFKRETNGEDYTYFKQKVDHFDPNNEETWNQRYDVNDSVEGANRDVAYLYLYGQVRENDLPYAAWLYDGKHTQPILFGLEHRYYAVSRTTPNLSTQNLKYLSSQQAIVDIAEFIKGMNEKHNLAPNVKWVVFGSFYTGNLAAWARQQYPELVFAAVSSSAPLQAKFDFSEYYHVVAEVLDATNQNCLTDLQEGYKQLEELLKDADNRHKLNNLFQLCSDVEKSFDKPLDLSTFYSAIASYFGKVVERNNQQLLDKEAFPDTYKICDILTNNTLGSELERLGTAAKLIVNKLYWFPGVCIPISYEKSIKTLRSESTDSFEELAERQWLYQQCTEFGFFQTSTNEPHIFGNNFGTDYFVQLCQDVFSPAFNKTFVENAVAKTNDFYHGLDIKVDNTIFVQGTLDPWYSLGLKNSISERAPVLSIEGGSHCADLSYPNGHVPKPVLDVILKVEEILSEWINN